MKVAVLGCSGGMGRYFVRRFLEDGHSVKGYDLTRYDEPPTGLTFAGSNAEAVADADVVLLSVPIGETAKVGQEAAPRLKEGAVVVEIASVKGGVREGLKGALRGRKVALLSVHPMFGPRSTSAHPKILVLGGSAEVEASQAVFPWADLILIGERDHDTTMAYALTLVHLVNLAFASAVSKGAGLDEFQKVCSPFGSAQINLARAVLSQDPALVSSVQFENPHSPEALSAMIEELQSLQKVIRAKKAGELEKRFASLAGEFQPRSLEAALDRVYSSFG